MTADLACRDERRRQWIRDRSLNGIDYVDVDGSHLCVHFLTGIPPEFQPSGRNKSLTADEKPAALKHIVIRGGRRVTGIHAIDIDPESAMNRYEESCLGIDLDKEGDWSSYTLCFVEVVDGVPTDTPMKSLDPRYACIDFLFHLDCPAQIDCKDTAECPPEERPKTAISYLAKDYATFRQLILDRLALLMPKWRERHVPDEGIAIVELLAYVGDYLSYYQDAVATEQYLDTARLRISVRRHARLVDYAMHEGCNARAFLDVEVSADVALDPKDIYFITQPPQRTPVPVVLRQSDLDSMAPGWLPFEIVRAGNSLALREAHNLIRIYTWGDEQCCLPKGAMSATLVDATPATTPATNLRAEAVNPPARMLQLKVGDFLLFEELACAGTVTKEFDGKTPEPDADPTHRHVVRLTKVTPNVDPLLGTAVLDVEWSREDALPFALCISAIGTAPQCDFVTNLAVARGNVLLVDHGISVDDEPLDPIPIEPQPERCEGANDLAEVARIAGRYRPVLRQAPLTFAQPVAAGASASALLQQDPRAALPAIVVDSIPPSVDDVTPLFSPADLADVATLAKTLIESKDPLRVALRRRLSAAVRALLDAGNVNEELIAALTKDLRSMMMVWRPRADLLGSGADDADFVAEIDDDGRTHLRFGDGDAGRAVDPGSAFLATYRAGNGRAGLVGRDAIAHAVYRKDFNNAIAGVRNPMPSTSAADPEPVAEVKMFAPAAFRKQLERAVTAGDYATLAEYLRFPQRNPRVQSAAADLRWNGSWYEADVAVDAFGSAELDPALGKTISDSLFRVRRMGHDLRVGGADIVALRLVLDLCVKANYLQAHVLTAVRDALSSRLLPDGQRGFFHPDNLTFGEAVYVSRIVAAVMAVDGVAEVHVVRLERLDDEDRDRKLPDRTLAQGLLRLGPTEVARLDNDPTAPENGILSFRHVRGGR